MKIKEVMNKAFAVDHDISVKEAAKIFSEQNTESLVAVKGGKIMGIITDKDIVDNIDNSQKKISAVMIKQVVTVDQEEDIDGAAMLMSKNKIKQLPVVDEKGDLVGIITATDLLAHSDELNEDFVF